jgi:hypothetical protein
LRDHVYLPDRAAASDAAELIQRFGDYAGSEAAQRAHRSRSVGNVVHYCRWRQIERMIALLASVRTGETVH